MGDAGTRVLCIESLSMRMVVVIGGGRGGGGGGYDLKNVNGRGR